MIHLVDHVYISYAETDIAHRKIKRANEYYIRVIDKNIAGFAHAETTVQERAVLDVKTVNELIEYFGSEEVFFQFLLTRLQDKEVPKILLYLDDTAHTEFLIRWWKSLFPSISADTAYALYINQGDYEYLRVDGKEENFINYEVDSKQIIFKDFYKKYWGLSEEEFKLVFDNAPAFVLPQDIKDLCSIEYLIMNYIIDANTPKKALLLERMEHLYTKAFLKEIMVSKLEMQRRVHMYVDDASFELNKVSAIPTIEKNAHFNFLVDEKISKDTSTLEHLKTNYNLPTLCFNILQNQLHFGKLCNVTGMTAQADYPCIINIIENKGQDSMEEILGQEIRNESKYRIFKNLIQTNRYNSMLVNSLKTSLEKNPDSPLKEELKLA